MSVNENETVNQSQSAAGGSGEKPEKLVADHVANSWEYITENGFDLLADVAVDTLVKNGAVPSDAYLHSVKTSWCLHRAAVHYALQYSKERVSADFVRADWAFEHGMRAQAEREAEKLKADLAQSALLVENLRLRIDEARTKETESPAAKWCRKIKELHNSLQQRQQELSSAFASNEELRQSLRSHKMKLETAEAALLEQQQRNEELVTQTSQQFLKIAELQRQVEAVKTQELDGKTQELDGKTQELPEYTPPDGWRLLQTGEPLRRGDLWITPSGSIVPLLNVGAEIVQPVNTGGGHYIRWIEPEPQPEKLPEGCRNDGGWSSVSGTAPEPWPVPQPQPKREPVQVREGRWRKRSGAEVSVSAMPTDHDDFATAFPWWDGQETTWTDSGHLMSSGECPADLVQYLGPIEPQVEALTVNGGDDSGGN